MTKNLPLIRLSAINPFLLELRRRGADASALLRELGLPARALGRHPFPGPGLGIRILGEVTPNPRGRRRGTALAVASPGDEHVLPSTMAAPWTR